MDDPEIRLKCIELAMSGDARATLERAKEFYGWVSEKPAPATRKKPASKKAPTSDL
jgi:hypothetical protein